MSTGKRALSGIIAAGVVLGVGELIAVRNRTQLVTTDRRRVLGRRQQSGPDP
ncbi:MAG: hypothetical protein U5N21_03410 [Rhodococcus sp. (in: high G+C Gram-positive bacteria)]|nr:hypothetical protein [Rhodococcus sp. (in: high G+C Gram-positive bacteria)]